MRPARAERSRIQLSLAALGVLLTSADTYVVVLALPEMMTGLGVGLDELQRAAPIVSAFLLGYVVVLPLIGRVSDLHGRTPVLVGCLLVFAFGSLGTATADDLGRAVAGRALQGLGAGGLVPTTLALVADRWPADRRGVPLGVIGGVQEAGTVLGPLYAGAVLATSGWRTIFWLNLAAAGVLAVGLRSVAHQSGRASRTPPIRPLLAVLAAASAVLVLAAPDALTSDLTTGRAFVPLWGESVLTSPLSAVAIILAAAALVVGSSPRALVRAASDVDLIGATLAGLSLAGVVLAFATADPSSQVVSRHAPLLLAGSAVLGAMFVLRQRFAVQPLVPTGALSARVAVGSLAVNTFVGAALVAALVNIPVFARATRYPDSQWGASLVLVQLLVALPVGAVLGGWLSPRHGPRLVAAGGMALAALGFVAMTQWSRTALDSPLSTMVLLAAGLGFGLSIAPVNQALLGATDDAVHGLAASAAVVARTVGMLVGLSALTAVGLYVFYERQREIGSPLTLCPDNPSDCPAYELASRAALLTELHAIFWGAAACAATAAALACWLLPRRTATTVASGGRDADRRHTEGDSTARSARRRPAQSDQWRSEWISGGEGP